MNRRTWLAAFAGAMLAPGRVRAQPRPRRIGYLLLFSMQDQPSRERQAFLDGLRDFGYVVGRDVEVIYRSAEGHAEFLEATCRELVKLSVELIVTAGGESALQAKRCAGSLPVVFLALGDPIGLGLSSSLSRPDHRLTGTSFLSSELAPKRMQLLREAAPAVKRVAVLWDHGNRNGQIEAAAAMAAARGLSLEAEAAPLRGSAAIGQLLGRIAERGTDALYVAFTGGAVADNRSVIAEFGLKRKIPVVSGWSFLTEAGALLSYAPDIPSMFRRGAHYVDAILRGAKPAELPIEQARVVELVLNARTAKAIGLTLPDSLLLRADRVIE